MENNDTSHSTKELRGREKSARKTHDPKPMAITTTFSFPALAEALDDFIATQLGGSIKKDLSWVTSISVKNLDLAGRFTSEDGKSLLFQGTVILHRDYYDTFIYTGKWTGQLFEMESLMCNLFSVKNDTLIYEGTSHQLETFSYAETGVEVIYSEFVRLKNSPIEFPLFPNRYMRMIGPDGDYVELNVATVKAEGAKPVETIDGIKVYRITRSFATGLSSGEVVKGYLDFGTDHSFILFSEVSGANKTEVSFLPGDFLNWLNERSQRNLLRALNVKAPSLKTEAKKLPAVPSTALAAAS